MLLDIRAVILCTITQAVNRNQKTASSGQEAPNEASLSPAIKKRGEAGREANLWSPFGGIKSAWEAHPPAAGRELVSPVQYEGCPQISATFLPSGQEQTSQGQHP